MKKTFLILLALIFGLNATSYAQVVKDYNPAIQRTTNMQYFKPAEEHLFAGDCMPFFHNGTFYLYWLLDEGHHAGLNGLGGHQWALSTTTDLINWKHYPVALGIDEEWEKSICTGSVVADGNKIYAFYSTRVKEGNDVHEQLSYAMSTDGGLSFKKQKPNPFYYAPKECISRDFRDPRAFKDKDGLFHLFVSGYEKDAVISGQGGYLVHLTSKDLKNWTETTSPLKGQNGVPECSDYFKWNDWYYLIYSTHGNTYYVKSKQPYGPWEYPPFQPMVEKWGNVGKTAEFKNGRRIVVSYMTSKKDNKDSDGMIWGGNILLRELFQDKDGILTVGQLPEVAPEMKAIPGPSIQIPDNSGANASIGKEILTINSTNGFGIATMNKLPRQYRITMTVSPEGNYDEIGLYLKSTDKNKKGYKLELNANKQLVGLFETNIESVLNLRKPIKLDITVLDDIIDVYINNERCIVNRLAEQKGENIIFFVKNGKAAFQDIKLYQIN
ncbi:family 43 glycosylhydrolase [Prevotella sp. 10(H)]|uniref:family 43 glycosylhydrolase n=1 Tax=Prevotella sp. 10(H) TaxID=1158294 RepID=UPI0004A6C5F2|nr:family 43 glycosylhydrolase [Prevotella sp. 10(H)]